MSPSELFSFLLGMLFYGASAAILGPISYVGELFALGLEKALPTLSKLVSFLPKELQSLVIDIFSFLFH